MKILNKLTLKHLTMNKKRTIVTIIGVILSTALMVGIGLLFASLRDNSIKTTIAAKGAQHVMIDEVPTQKLNILENNIEIKSVYYRNDLGFSRLSNSDNAYKPYVLVSEASKELLENLNLLKGRLPKNNNEIVISSHMKTNGGIIYKIGDVVTYNVGKRKFSNGEETLSMVAYENEEEIVETVSKTYKIVGIVERSFIEDYSSPGYMVFTKLEDTKVPKKVHAYLVYKKVKDIYDKVEILGKNLGFSKQENRDNLHFNDALLSAYGVSRYSNIIDSLMGTIVIILTLISIGCTIVIYNSFAISVMERKKQFGLFSSIGATRKQLRHTVFFEALIVGIIGIPLGILSALLGIGIVLMIVNQLLPDLFSFPLALSIYPTFIIIPVIFMVAVILLSAFFPAYRASKITPIEAIRQNDDIKIRGKKLKTYFWVKALFGIEGEIALKNMKRNKKKYRITIISLFVSIVLFVSFSSLLNYGLQATNEVVINPNYDLSVNIQTKEEEKVKAVYETLKGHDEVEKISFIEDAVLDVAGFEGKYSDKAKKILNEENSYTYSKTNIETNTLYLFALDDKTYQTLLKDMKLNKEAPILINRTRHVNYSASDRKTEIFDIFKEPIDKLSIYQSIYDEKNDFLEKQKVLELKNIVYTDITPLGTEYTSTVTTPSLLVSEEMFQTIMNALEGNEYYGFNIYIKAPHYQKIDKYLKDLDNMNDFLNYNYYNVRESMQLQKNMIFVMKLLLYGFITLVTLIGVTSVFNTINTSIALRRKEFAMLRSVGLTPRGFNKILYFESIFFGFKSLLYGIPVSLFVTYLIGKQIGGIVTVSTLMIPFGSILLAVIGVFLIVIMAMLYASSRIKKENILEAIREENI